MKQPAFTSLHADNLLGIKDQSVYHLASAMLSTARATEGLPKGDFNFDHLKSIHKHLVQDLHVWAGTTRTTNKATAGADASQIETLAAKAIENFTRPASRPMSNDEFAVKASICYANLVNISPFPDGNNRAIRSFLKEYAQSIDRDIKWENIQADKFNFAVERAMTGDISLLSNQLKDAVVHRDLFDEYNSETLNTKTLEIAAFAGIGPAALESLSKSNPTLESLAQDVTQRLIKDLALHSQGLPSKIDWEMSSIKHEVAGSRNADILNSGIAEVLSPRSPYAEPAPPSKSHEQRLG